MSYLTTMKNFTTFVFCLLCTHCTLKPVAQSETKDNINSTPTGITFFPPIDAVGSLTLYKFGVIVEGKQLDEYNENTWYALVQDVNHSYLRKTNLHFYQDSDTENVWRAEAAAEGELYLTGINLIEGSLKTSHFYPRPIESDSTITLHFEGIRYLLYATSNDDRSNYKLYLSKDGGDVTDQHILTIPHFDDHIVQLLWFGDLDRDEKPDMILDMSHKYSVCRIGVFLSATATNKTIMHLEGHLYGYFD